MDGKQRAIDALVNPPLSLAPGHVLYVHGPNTPNVIQRALRALHTLIEGVPSDHGYVPVTEDGEG